MIIDEMTLKFLNIPYIKDLIIQGNIEKVLKMYSAYSTRDQLVYIFNNAGIPVPNKKFYSPAYDIYNELVNNKIPINDSNIYYNALFATIPNSVAPKDLEKYLDIIADIADKFTKEYKIIEFHLTTNNFDSYHFWVELIWLVD